MSNYFDPGVLNNHIRFTEFLKHVPASEPKIWQTPFSRLRVCWIIAKTPFEALISVAFSALAHISALVNRKLSRIFTILSVQMNRDWNLLCKHWELGSQLLVPSTYCPQIGTSDAYGQAPFPVADIKSPEVKGLIWKEIQPSDFESEQNESVKVFKYRQYVENQKKTNEAALDFFPDEGFAPGIALIFIHYFLSSEKQDTEALNKVAEHFHTGFPRQATILNAFRTGFPEQALGLKKESMGQIHLYELNLDKQKGKRKLVNLAHGVYQINILNQSLVFVKMQEGTFAFDPHFGLLKISSEEIFDHLIKYHHQKENPKTQIDIYKYSK